MHQSNISVDIIIPVYNALEALKECVKSLYKHTDLQKNKVFFVNDKSSDPLVLAFLKEQEKDNVIVIDNETNMGFAGSVNAAAGLGTGDILLLNSDTVITEGWLEKICRCAYSDEGIATVTPLSNNAAICSVPEFNTDNLIPEGFTVDSFARFVQQHSMTRYPEIPVAVGFCMFIKRNVYQKVGGLNCENFPRGYGEEIDFCFKAEQLGYRHVMCDDTFIYHKGTVSFSDPEKARLISDANIYLEKKYPAQMRQMHLHCLNNPNSEIFDNLKIASKLANKKTNLLYFIQSDFRKEAYNNIGGTQFHVEDLTLGLKKRYNVFVAARDREHLSVTAYIGDEVFLFKYNIGMLENFQPYRNAMIRELCEKILRCFQIDIVHIHHVLGLSFDIFHVAKEYGAHVYTSIHDYYYICPTLKMLDKDNKLCIGVDTPDGCRQCMNKSRNIAEDLDYIANWRLQCEDALAKSDWIFIPSESAKRSYEMYYPSISEKIKVISHGVNPYECFNENNIPIQITDDFKCAIEKTDMIDSKHAEITGWAYIDGVESEELKAFVKLSDSSGKTLFIPAKLTPRDDVARIINRRYLLGGFCFIIPLTSFAKGKIRCKVLLLSDGVFYTDKNNTVFENQFASARHESMNIAFIGGLSVTKGSQIAYKLINKSQIGINWFAMGGIGDGDLLYLKKDNYTKTGWYDRESLPYLMRAYNIHIVCIFPICPETFCYTASEAILSGVPVMAFGIGALGERAELRKCGWVLPADSDIDSILSAIESIRLNPDEYQEKLNCVRNIKLRDVHAMVDDYESIYLHRDIIKNKTFLYDPEFATEGYSLGSSRFKNEEIAQMYVKFSETEARLQSIENSFLYKVFIQIDRIRFPFRSQLKNLIVKAHNLYRRVRY